MRTSLAVFFVAATSLVVGCKGSPASPFNTYEDAPISVFRLQNFQEPVAAAPTPAAPTQPGVPLIPGLPAEWQAQIQQGAQMICQWLPPGSPGCGGSAIPGVVTPQAQPNAPMFEGYRIIGQAQAMDPKIREDIIDIFGYEENFSSKKSPCMFPELGLEFGGGGPQSARALVSFSCNQVQARNFNWPHPDNGMKENTVKKLSVIVQKLFGGG